MIYVIKAMGTNFYKIGFTGGSVQQRYKAISANCPLELTIFCTMEGGHTTEKELHRKLMAFHVRNEWFSLTTDEVHSLLDMSRFHPLP